MATADALLKADLERAQKLAADALYDEALDILEGYLEERLPEEAIELLGQIRAALEPLYARRFPCREAILKTTVSAKELQKQPLRAKHAYLWVLCGNGMSVDDLLSLSPMHPLDSLRALAKLSDLGLIVEHR